MSRVSVVCGIEFLGRGYSGVLEELENNEKTYNLAVGSGTLVELCRSMLSPPGGVVVFCAYHRDVRRDVIFPAYQEAVARFLSRMSDHDVTTVLAVRPWVPPGFTSRQGKLVGKIADWFGQMSNQTTKFQLVDAPLGEKSFTSDGFHLNRGGAVAVADAISAELNRL